MNYNSLSEYFYKLYNICLLLMLLPLAALLTLYYLLNSEKLISVMSLENESAFWLVLLFPVVVVIKLTIVHLVLYKKYVLTDPLMSLGDRLDRYYSFVIIKGVVAAAASLLMAVGLYFTGRGIFSIYFLLILVWSFVQWPFPRRVSNDLKLRGDEQKMVLTKGEAFK